MSRTTASVFALILAATTVSSASAAGKAFVPFGDFLAGVERTDYDDYSARRGMRAADRLEFGRMREHVLKMYEGVEVAHSFVDDTRTFDCVAVEQQPGVRHLGPGYRIAEPPAAVEPKKSPNDRTRFADSAMSADQRDAYGNTMRCAAGTIPMARLDLDDMTRFQSLERFFKKTPFEDGDPRDEAAKAMTAAASNVHLYAHAYQNVSNHGGSSLLNLWRPTVNTNLTQIFSLSQQWYVGGSGASRQTVEGGWQNYPQFYGTTSSVLFIYFTPDNYATGCYNLTCAGFVQTNNAWHFGGTFSAYSTLGGTQYEFGMQWKHWQGNWWLFLSGSNGFEAVGYYPDSLYHFGQLDSYATRVDFGGETVGSNSWPKMGSGKHASAGFGQAAFQRKVFYIDGGYVSRWANLTPVQNTPSCYTIKRTPSSQGGSWGTYIYFGGPGGTTCN